jgi:hypothetical protein
VPRLQGAGEGQEQQEDLQSHYELALESGLVGAMCVGQELVQVNLKRHVRHQVERDRDSRRSAGMADQDMGSDPGRAVEKRQVEADMSLARVAESLAVVAEHMAEEEHTGLVDHIRQRCTEQPGVESQVDRLARASTPAPGHTSHSSEVQCKAGGNFDLAADIQSVKVYLDCGKDLQKCQELVQRQQ